MEDAYREYVTFQVTARDGSDVEMAVVDEFDFEEKHFVVAAAVIGDTIEDEGRYIYRSIIEGDDFSIEKIEDESEYGRIAEAYLNLDE